MAVKLLDGRTDSKVEPVHQFYIKEAHMQREWLQVAITHPLLDLYRSLMEACLFARQQTSFRLCIVFSTDWPRVDGQSNCHSSVCHIIQWSILSESNNKYSQHYLAVRLAAVQIWPLLQYGPQPWSDHERDLGQAWQKCEFPGRSDTIPPEHGQVFILDWACTLGQIPCLHAENAALDHSSQNQAGHGCLWCHILHADSNLYSTDAESQSGCSCNDLLFVMCRDGLSSSEYGPQC